jgi:hypothetical protein
MLSMSRNFEAAQIDFGPDIQEGCTLVTERYWAPDVMLARGMISEALYAAAKRFRDDYYAGQAGRLGAREAFTRASRAVGATAMPGLAWTVLSHGTVTGWAECKGIEMAKAAGQVAQGLERLAKHYSPEN